MNRHVSISLLLVCLILLCGSQAAHAQYRFDHWTADNGLPQNSVRDILQTRDGYLWMTTFDGLVRFDGVRFTVFDKINSPGIITNRFVSLYEEANGDLWASTESTGITRLHNGIFTTYKTENGIPDNTVTFLGGDGQCNVLRFCADHLFRWVDSKFQPADDLRLSPDEVRSNNNQHLAVAQYQERFVCFAEGQLRSWKWANLPFIPISGPMQDSQGYTWFSGDEGLIKTRNGQIVKVYTQRDGLPGKRARLVYGRLPLQALITSDGGDLYLTNLESMQTQLVTRKPPEGAPVYTSYADREGNIWFGTLTNGLFRAHQQSITTYAKSQGLSSP